MQEVRTMHWQCRRLERNRFGGRGERGALTIFTAILVLILMTLMVLYATVLRLVTWLGPRTRSPGSEGYEVLLTGTFYSQNWINAHLRPLAMSQRCARVWVVSTFKIDPVDKVVLVSPPAALVRWIGAVPARLLTFLWVGVRRRPHRNELGLRTVHRLDHDLVEAEMPLSQEESRANWSQARNAALQPGISSALRISSSVNPVNFEAFWIEAVI